MLPGMLWLPAWQKQHELRRCCYGTGGFVQTDNNRMLVHDLRAEEEAAKKKAAEEAAKKKAEEEAAKKKAEQEAAAKKKAEEAKKVRGRPWLLYCFITLGAIMQTTLPPH